MPEDNNKRRIVEISRDMFHWGPGAHYGLPEKFRDDITSMILDLLRFGYDVTLLPVKDK